jgi:hypothetical protein
MPNRPTACKNILMNGDDIRNARLDLNQDDWERGVNLQISNLLQVSPCQTSGAVLREIAASSTRKILIVPAREADGGDQSEPIKGVEWPGSVTPNIRDATPQGEPPLWCADGPIEGRSKIGQPVYTPEFVARLKAAGKLPNGEDMTGTGKGSDSAVYFTSQDHLNTLALPGGRPDEVLLHELVHALRSSMALTLCVSPSNIIEYDTVEEFYAILIANIYRSENGYRDLRSNHSGVKTALAPPLTDEAVFYRMYQGYVDTLVQQMPSLCCGIGMVMSKFNPIRKALSKGCRDMGRGLEPIR